MNVLVTGASGFLGSHLVDLLAARGDTVLALRRKSPADPGGQKNLKIIEGDILDVGLLNRIVQEESPGEIYHLAAQSFPSVSWKEPWPTHQVNVLGTLNVLEAARQAKNQPAVVVASSASIYAQRADGTPIREEDPCQPASPYGVSKLAADHHARLYAQRYGMRVVCARPFFLIGPRKTGDVLSDWVRGIVAVERGAARELAVGNIEVVRDFLHYGDGVAALATLAARGKPGQAYNISSGRGWNLADLLKALTGMARSPVPVRVDAAKLRPLDERVKIGDSTKLQALGWQPQQTVEQALRETLDYWRKQP